MVGVQTRKVKLQESLVMKKMIIALSLLGCVMTTCWAQTEDVATFRTWAMTPPMGWNSWDCYYSSVTEKEVLQNAQYLVDLSLIHI